jgi:16S rRNA (cytidine1402-2'-O)-methyltransferase
VKKTIDEEELVGNLSEKEHVEHYISEGYRSKEAIKKAAVDRGVPKRKMYDAYHIQNKKTFLLRQERFLYNQNNYF